MTPEELVAQILADPEAAPVADVPEDVLDEALYLLAERASEEQIDSVWSYAWRLQPVPMARLACRVARSPLAARAHAKPMFIRIGRAAQNELGERELSAVIKDEQERWEERHR